MASERRSAFSYDTSGPGRAPAPAWFIALDLIVAYIPMAWLATLLGSRFSSRS